MLHEVLLALSGHPSPIFDDTNSFPYITPPESALLQSLGHLATLHRALKNHTARVASKHPSTICRAVANTIRLIHLKRFQTTILDVERRILSSDSTHVGAYGNVPLSCIVGDFNKWHRPLEWLWDMLCFMMPADYQQGVTNPKAVGNGPALINKLRRERLTGFAEIEELAVEVLKAAEAAWLKQLSTFLMTSERLGNDFFIQRTASRRGSRLRVSKRYLPEFVSLATGLSALHIGRASKYLDQAKNSHSKDANLATNRSSTISIEKIGFLESLAKLQLPITIRSLDASIATIRTSITNLLTTAVLPSGIIIDTIEKLSQILLLQRVDFADALIMEADSYVRNRHSQLHKGVAGGLQGDLAAVTLREGELHAILSKTWTVASNDSSKESNNDLVLEWARENITLNIVTPSEPEGEDGDNDADDPDLRESVKSKGGSFNDFLLPVPTYLSFRLHTPLDLILTEADLDTYSIINNYLLSIRRAHVRLTSLWRQAALRKGAAYVAGPKSSYRYRMHTSGKLRKRFSERDKAMRNDWVACSQAVRLLVELGEYLISHVGQRSWETFQTWIQGGAASTLENTEIAGRKEPDDLDVSRQKLPLRRLAENTSSIAGQRDPELIAEAHRQYLSSFYTELMLDQHEYTKPLRTFLHKVDQFVAFIQRLHSIQAKLDLADEGVDDGFSERYVSEEQETHAELHRAGERLNTATSHLHAALRNTDKGANTQTSHRTGSSSQFVPWTGGSVDRFLMRLDFDTADEPPV